MGHRFIAQTGLFGTDAVGFQMECLAATKRSFTGGTPHGRDPDISPASSTVIGSPRRPWLLPKNSISPASMTRPGAVRLKGAFGPANFCSWARRTSVRGKGADGGRSNEFHGASRQSGGRAGAILDWERDLSRELLHGRRAR